MFLYNVTDFRIVNYKNELPSKETIIHNCQLLFLCDIIRLGKIFGQNISYSEGGLICHQRMIQKC
jgi:hypothetical protein